MLDLVRWRYRFVLPSPGILRTLAAHYRGNPPGRPLQEVAEYVHDCMRDTGLFGGPENTDLKDSMAMRLFLTWMNLVSEFLMQVWEDDDFSEDTSEQLTEWAVRELLPSPPRVVHGSVKVRAGSMTARLLLSYAVIHAEASTDALQAMQKALRLSNDEYERIMTELLNDSR